MRKTTEKHRSDRHNEQKDSNARSKEVRGQSGKNREESRSTKVNRDAEQEDRPSRSRSRDRHAKADAKTGRTRSKSAKRDRNDSSEQARDPPPRTSKAETRKSTKNPASTDVRDATNKKSKSKVSEDVAPRSKKSQNSKSTTTTPQAQRDKAQSSQQVSSKQQPQKSKTTAKQQTRKHATNEKQSESKVETKAPHPEKRKTTSIPKQVEEARSKKSHGSDEKRTDTQKSEKSNAMSSQKYVDESRSKKSNDTSAKSSKKSGRQSEKSKTMASPKHSESHLRKSQETHEKTSKLPPTQDKTSSAATTKTDEASAKRSHASKAKEQMADDVKSSRSKKSQGSRGLSSSQKTRVSADISRSPSKKSQRSKSEPKTPTSPSKPSEMATDTHTFASSARNSQDRGSRINTVTFYTEKTSTKSSQRNGTKYDSHYTDDTPEEVLKMRAEITRRQKEYLRSLLRPRIAFIKDSTATAVDAIVGMTDNTAKAVGDMINHASACHENASKTMDDEYWKSLKNGEYNIFNHSSKTKSTGEENTPDANDELNDTSRTDGAEEGEAIDNMDPNGLEVERVETNDGVMSYVIGNGIESYTRGCGAESICCWNWGSERSPFGTSSTAVLTNGPLPPPDEIILKSIDSHTVKLEGDPAAQVSDESTKHGTPEGSPSEVEMEGHTLVCTKSNESSNTDSSSVADHESMVSDMTPVSTKSKNYSTMNRIVQSATSGIDKESGNLNDKTLVSGPVSQIKENPNDPDDDLLALVATVTDGMEAMLPEEFQVELENFHHEVVPSGWLDTASISESIATYKLDDSLLALVASVSSGMETMLPENSGTNDQTNTEEEHSRVYNFIVDGNEEEDALIEHSSKMESNRTGYFGNPQISSMASTESSQGRSRGSSDPMDNKGDAIKLSLEISTTASKHFESVETEFVERMSKVSAPICGEAAWDHNSNCDSGKGLTATEENVNLLFAKESSAKEEAIKVEPNVDGSVKEDSAGKDESSHSSTPGSPRFLWSLNKIANIVKKRKTPNGSIENSSEDPDAMMKLLSKDSSNCTVVTSQSRDSVANSLSASLPGISGFASADTAPWSNINVAKDRLVVDNSTNRVVPAHSKVDQTTGVDMAPRKAYGNVVPQETIMPTDNAAIDTITATKEQETDSSTAIDLNISPKAPGMEARALASKAEGGKDAVPITSNEKGDTLTKEVAIDSEKNNKELPDDDTRGEEPSSQLVLQQNGEPLRVPSISKEAEDSFDRDSCFLVLSQSTSELRDEAIECSLEDCSPGEASKDETPEEREASSVTGEEVEEDENSVENEVESTNEDPIEHISAKDAVAKKYNSRMKSKKFRKNVMRWRNRNRENLPKLPSIAE